MTTTAAEVAADLTTAQRAAILAASIGHIGNLYYLVPDTDPTIAAELVGLGLAEPAHHTGYYAGLHTLTALGVIVHDEVALAGFATTAPPAAPPIDLAALGAGVLIEAVPSGTSADGTPITRTLRRRLDRAPWAYDPKRGTVVISDGRAADVVNVDSIRVLEGSAPAEQPAPTGAQANPFELGHILATTDTMTVTVRDRSAERPWGSGPNDPAIRTVTISAACPRCGGPRGEPTGRNQHDDGAWYWVQIWSNPCGHVDMYEDVVREARQLAESGEQHG